MIDPETTLAASAGPSAGMRSVRDLTAGLAASLQHLVRYVRELLAGAINWFGVAIEPALEWLARRRWLGSNLKSVVGKIVALNLLGLSVLTLAILFFSPVQASFVQAKLESMISEAEILASSIGSTATRESDRVVIAPELLDPSRNEELKRAIPERSLQFPIRPERLATVIRPVVEVSGMRVRLFRTDGTFMYDSRELPEAAASGIGWQGPDFISSFWTRLSDWMDGTDLRVYRDIGRANVTVYPEVAEALKGKSAAFILMSESGRRTVTIVTPVKRKENLGILLLSTRDGEIDKLVWTERKTIIWLGVAGLLMMAITSLLLAGTIALPLRQLAQAADGIQTNLRRRQDLPDFSYRRDEIADLSTTLSKMTDALYKRIESSERFAADVAHELKNPLTSVRSAAETLARVKSDADRTLLTDTIQNDVKRLTRLIDDISKATRADADMALNDAAPVNLASQLSTLAEMFNSLHVADGQHVVLELAATGMPLQQAYTVIGHDIRLGQVFKNLLDNALSFSPAPGHVWVKVNRDRDRIQIAVEDEGPGIPAGNLEKIFNRFYTDRPVGSFGNNSGLGLSICEEIVKAHGGTIRAENRIANSVQRTRTSELGVVASQVLGARFVVELPAAQPLPQQRYAYARTLARR